VQVTAEPGTPGKEKIVGKARAAKAARRAQRDRIAGAHFWHGGIGGLTAGEEIIPPTLQDVYDPMSSALYLAEAQANRVYFTTDRELARVFASAVFRGRGSGALYRVQPIGDVLTDPDFPTVGLHSRRAVILQVEELTIALTPEEEQRRQAPYLTWDDGRPIYDLEGRIQITWQMEAHGLTQAELDRQFPRWMRPEDAMRSAAEMIRRRHA